MEKENIKISDAALFERLETEKEHYFNIYSKVVTDERTTIKNKNKRNRKIVRRMCKMGVIFDSICNCYIND